MITRVLSSLEFLISIFKLLRGFKLSLKGMDIF